MKKLFILFLLFCSLANSYELFAAEKQTITTQPRLDTPYSMMSSYTGQLQTWYVILPDYYDPKKPGGYPVLYLLDGQYLLGHTATIAQFLQGAMPSIIVVGIDNPDRVKTLTPPAIEFAESTKKPDRANTLTSIQTEQALNWPFMNFVQHELMPQVDKTLNTAPYRLFAGHSLGGVAVLNSMILRPEMANAWLAFSPAMHWQDGATTTLLTHRLAALDSKEYLYIGYEIEDVSSKPVFLQRHQQGLARLNPLMKEHAPETLNWTLATFEHEDHITVAPLAQHQAFRHLFSDWFLSATSIGDNISAITDWYQQLSQRFGYPVVPEESELHQLTSYFSYGNKPEMALKIAEQRVSWYSHSPYAHRSLALAQEAVGQSKQALQSLKLAHQYLNSKQSPMLSNEERDRLTQEINTIKQRLVSSN